MADWRQMLLERHTARQQQVVGWEEGAALYQLKVLEPGFFVVAGTDYPRALPDMKAAKHRAVVHVEFQTPPDAKQARRLMQQIWRALNEQTVENRAAAGLSLLGAEDTEKTIPFSRPLRRGVHAFWLHRSEYKSLALALRTHYDDKSALKSAIDLSRAEADGKEFFVHSGWEPHMKIWWVFAPHAYPRVLGELRHAGFKLTWIKREGMPAAPPVEMVK